MNTSTEQTTYILQKDLPDGAVKGDRYNKVGDRYFNERLGKSKSPVIEHNAYFTWQVENNPEWFKEEERIVVGKMSCREDGIGWALKFKTNKHIHYDKAVDLCNLLERHLNGELNNPAPKTFTAPESLADHPMCKKEEPKQSVTDNVYVPLFSANEVMGMYLQGVFYKDKLGVDSSLVNYIKNKIKNKKEEPLPIKVEIEQTYWYNKL